MRIATNYQITQLKYKKLKVKKRKRKKDLALSHSSRNLVQSVDLHGPYLVLASYQFQPFDWGYKDGPNLSRGARSCRQQVGIAMGRIWIGYIHTLPKIFTHKYPIPISINIHIQTYYPQIFILYPKPILKKLHRI